MCTVSHCLVNQRLLVTMNRDERRERAPESPLRRHDDGPVLWVGPGDGEAGGAWIGANSHGTVACLLNGYPATEVAGAPTADRSRGEIIPAVMSHGPAKAALDWLFNEFDPSPYGAFNLLVYSPSGGMIASWDGVGRLRADKPFPSGWGMVTSSSWNQQEVVQWRHQKFHEWVADPRFEGELPSYNLLREPGREWWSPLVSRDWSVTRSITQVEVRDGVPDASVEARYWPRPFDAPGPPDFRLRIPLAGVGESRSGRMEPDAVAIR